MDDLSIYNVILHLFSLISHYFMADVFVSAIHFFFDTYPYKEQDVCVPHKHVSFYNLLHVLLAHIADGFQAHHKTPTNFSRYNLLWSISNSAFASIFFLPSVFILICNQCSWQREHGFIRMYILYSIFWAAIIAILGDVLHQNHHRTASTRVAFLNALTPRTFRDAHRKHHSPPYDVNFSSFTGVSHVFTNFTFPYMKSRPGLLLTLCTLTLNHASLLYVLKMLTSDYKIYLLLR